MIESATLAEVTEFFPMRDLSINGAPQTTMHTMFKETRCAYCGEPFGYYPSQHLYKCCHKKRRLYFCKPSCLNSFRNEHKTALDQHIEKLKARIEYLEAQEKLPTEERTVTGDIYALKERANARLNTALMRKCTREGLL